MSLIERLVTAGLSEKMATSVVTTNQVKIASGARCSVSEDGGADCGAPLDTSIFVILLGGHEDGMSAVSSVRVCATHAAGEYLEATVWHCLNMRRMTGLPDPDTITSVTATVDEVLDGYTPLTGDVLEECAHELGEEA